MRENLSLSLSYEEEKTALYSSLFRNINYNSNSWEKGFKVDKKPVFEFPVSFTFPNSKTKNPHFQSTNFAQLFKKQRGQLLGFGPLKTRKKKQIPLLFGKIVYNGMKSWQFEHFNIELIILITMSWAFSWD